MHAGPADHAVAYCPHYYLRLVHTAPCAGIRREDSTGVFPEVGPHDWAAATVPVPNQPHDMERTWQAVIVPCSQSNIDYLTLYS
jgi:hypothetical protein